MHVGLTNEITFIVTEKDTALYVGSGSLNVFATPKMIALMEMAAAKAVEPFLEEGTSTVGTKIDVSHIAATPVSMKVTVKAVLKEIDKRKLTFDVFASDEKEEIGLGTHQRFIIYNEKFEAKAIGKIV